MKKKSATILISALKELVPKILFQGGNEDFLIEYEEKLFDIEFNKCQQSKKKKVNVLCIMVKIE